MLELTATADGSFTIYNSTVGENYHSKHGALQESKHVFLESGLIHFLSSSPNIKAVSVLEVGFGTGLNFLLSADYCSSRGIKLNYTGIEAFPLPENLLSQTGYSNYVNQDIWLAFLKSYQEALAKNITLNGCCDYRIAETKLEDFNTDNIFDVLYFDAFAAVHQPKPSL